jgi:hypothetical protein
MVKMVPTSMVAVAKRRKIIGLFSIMASPF